MSEVGSLKGRIRQGHVVVGLQASLDIGRGQLEDALAQGSYDYLYLDGQHTQFSEGQLVSFCEMADELALPVQFRIPHTRHTYLIGRYLDMGLSSIMVPEVADEATVDEAIAYCYYPQVGHRSWGGTARRGLPTPADQVDRLAYAAWWNEHVVLTIQLESVDAIVHARQLAKPGVDYVTFGPSDLLFSLEAHPQFPLRSIEACIGHVVEQLVGSEVQVGIPGSVPGERERFLEMGATVFLEAPQPLGA